MEIVTQTLEQLYKPILPHQIRQFWEAKQPFRMIDFAGQKMSFFFSQLAYAEELATSYACELHETCFVLAFTLEPTSYPFIEYCGDAGEHGTVYGIAAEHLDQCFPGGRQQAKLMTACHAPANSFDGHTDESHTYDDRQQHLFEQQDNDSESNGKFQSAFDFNKL